SNGQLLLGTQYRLVDLNDTESRKAGVEWWERLTSTGAEGMVVKPLDFVAKGRRGLVQPAIKCRGLEYLRIIYGPEYTAQGNLERLRSRSLSTKRSLALVSSPLGSKASSASSSESHFIESTNASSGCLRLKVNP